MDLADVLAASAPLLAELADNLSASALLLDALAEVLADSALLLAALAGGRADDAVAVIAPGRGGFWQQKATRQSPYDAKSPHFRPPRRFRKPV